MFIEINVTYIYKEFFFFLSFFFFSVHLLPQLTSASCGQHEISPFSLLVCFYVLKLIDV